MAREHLDRVRVSQRRKEKGIRAFHWLGMDRERERVRLRPELARLELELGLWGSTAWALRGKGEDELGCLGFVCHRFLELTHK